MAWLTVNLATRRGVLPLRAVKAWRVFNRAFLPLAVLSCVCVSGCYYSASRPLPNGLSYCSEAFPTDDARFLYDQTYLGSDGKRVCEQRIFDEALALIGNARKLVVVDLFLYNPFMGADSVPHRRLCQELTEALIVRKRAVPELEVVVITDPINTVYGGLVSRHLARLREAGIEVVMTDLDRLRDSNPLWSGFWRIWAWPWGNNDQGGWLANPFGEGEVTLRSWLAVLNFKANHRKVVVADQDGRLRALVTSANPHDGSSAHTNVGAVFGGPAAQAVLDAERAVMAFSGGRASPMAGERPSFKQGATATSGTVRVQLVTEEKIADAAEAMIGATEKGDTIDLVMFYLSDRALLGALKAASRRGVTLRVILDPNKDAFGRGKNGMPNRQVARELVAAGVPVRWAVTHGEQMHTKLLLVRKRSETAELLLGSANFTRRNVRDYNLEADVRVSGPASSPVLMDAASFAGRFWTNPDGCVFTTGYETFHDDSRWRVFLYRVQEATGLCTW